MPSLSLEYMAHGSLHHLLVKKLDLKYLFEDVLNKIWTIVLSTFNLLKQNLKSVNSNFTLAVHSQKFGQAKTHFLSHHNVCYVNRFADFLTRDQWSNG